LHASAVLISNLLDAPSFSRGCLLQTLGRCLHRFNPLFARRVLIRGCADRIQILDCPFLARAARAKDMPFLLSFAKLEIRAKGSSWLCDVSNLCKTTFLWRHLATRPTRQLAAT
jgi:hypothetical protein